MRKHQLFFALFLAIILSTMLSACGFSEKKVEMKDYTHKEGDFSFRVPIDWKKVKEDKEKVVFKANNQPITFYALEELGGISIYTADEVGKMLVNEFKKKMKATKVLRDSYSYSMDKAYRIVFTGKVEGQEYYVKAFIREQDYGIRHYLIFLTPAHEFYDLDSLFEDIAASFKLSKKDIDLYKKLSPHFNKDEKLKEKKKDESQDKSNDKSQDKKNN